ncbi:MAG: 50S ribosomal protein L6 [Clostridia bacterium]|nr:50S ribosomal protein L6 [Clostridia bacterium]
MSRIGRKEIILPAGVSLTVDKNNLVTVSGKKGELTQQIDKVITVNNKDNIVTLTRANDINTVRAKHGLYRALIANMVEGVSNGFTKTLTIKGVGYKAQKKENKLLLNLGLSHQIIVEEEKGITLECPSVTEIKISGTDKQKVGQIASKIRDLRPVEPYHGYGVRYNDEVVIHKVGKTAGKGKK